MRKTLMAAVVAAAGMSAFAGTAPDMAKMHGFITDLIGRMTLEEKIGQLTLTPGNDFETGELKATNLGQAAATGRLGSAFNVRGAEKVLALQKLAVEQSRLGIPLLIGLDVIHGYVTTFPIPLAMSCSWDLDAIEESARIAAREASAAGINWTFSPMVDICRDARWGRVAEGAGEDPYLGSQISAAMVRGYQGKDLSEPDNIMACVKHFALYGAPDGGRDYNTVDMSRQRMYNDYFPPYRAAVDAGAGSVMSSFNSIDGIPATANRWLLTDVLRDQWNFDGFVVTDYGSIYEIYNHGFNVGEPEAATALKAGTDMDMAAGAFTAVLAKALEDGYITEADIDTAVRRVLEAKYKLGLFDNPYKYNDVEREKTDIFTPANRARARAIAAETFVLLKNENNLLPLAPKGKIALIGPLADAANNMTGTWSVTPKHKAFKSLKQAFEDAVGPEGEIIYAKGCNIDADPQIEHNMSRSRSVRDNRSEQELLDEALAVAAQADVIVAAMGEPSEASGESSSRSRLELPDTQKKLLRALLATGKPVVMLNFSGRPNVLAEENETVPAIMNVWFGGSEAGDAIADVVFGKVNPSGKLTTSMPRNEGQIPIFYSHLNTGRPNPDDNTFTKFRSNYLDVANSPLYPFGYGLSYTTFDYLPIELNTDSMTTDSTVKASVTVTNTGSRSGDEIVQFYIRDVSASVSRPVKELKHFERIHLLPGESKTVSFDIAVDDLKFYNSALEHVAEPGRFDVMAGPDSERLTTASFTLR